MKKIIYLSFKIAKFVLPDSLYKFFRKKYFMFLNRNSELKTFQKFQKYFYKKNQYNLLEKNQKLLNAGEGKSAFLFATGPSLKLENLKQLSGQDCYSVSNFFLHEDLNSVNPKIHFFAPYHPPLILENYIDWLNLADKTLPKDTKICLGHTGYDLVQKYNLFSGREIYYLYLNNTTEIKDIDLIKPVTGPQTGPLMILPVLIYMGYSKIYLLGCDHTTLRDYKKNITNFYDPSKDIRIGSNYWGENVIEPLKAELNVFIQYDFWKKIAESKSIEIINLSQDSWLDMFKFNKLENVL